MKNKGFTLIELLAVIVILAIVALIATPLVLGLIENVRKDAYKASLRGIFEATDIYIASNEFSNFPNEGIPIVDDSIKLKNKEFTSGKIIKNEEGQLVLQDISNGVYCGNGTINDLVVVKGNCYSADTTPPTDVSIGSGTVTSNSITIVAAAMDVESAISGYEFSSDDGSTWTAKQTSNVYTFTGLTNNTNYTFKIRATNNNDLTTESSSLTVSTNNIPLLTYSISTSDWTDSAVVTIMYPERKEGYVYEYSLDNASTWEEVTSPSISKDITFTDNGSVIARISDGVNEVSATSYDVANIDTTAPVITVNPTTVTTFVGVTYTDSGVTANDVEMGDITSDIVITGSVDTSTEGTYTLTYNVSDAVGHAATEVTRTVNVIKETYTFSYTGSSQTWTVPMTGSYKLEVWGAEGSSGRDGYFTPGEGGLGGYSSGNKILSAGTQISIFIGGQTGFNGGGTGGVGNATTGSGGNGGGATDIRLGGTSLNDRIIVAGGGGGGGSAGTSKANGSGYRAGGGVGGGTGVAGSGGSGDCCGGTNGTSAWLNGGGQTYTSGYGCSNGCAGGGGAGGDTAGGGLGKCVSSNSCNSNGTSGSFGQGGNGGIDTYYGYGGAGAGGGGWYGGGGGNSYGSGGGGGGGSGYVGGVTNGQSIPGSSSMPSPNGGNEIGHPGNGKVRITYIGD